MPSNCSSSDSGSYYVRHDPFPYYSDITGNSARCAKVVPAGSTSCGSGGSSVSACDSTFLSDLNGASPAQYIWLTPNGCNDMHDCGVSTGDSYLQTLVPQILSSTLFKNPGALLVITFDEDSGGSGSPNLYTVFAGPAAKKAYSSSASYNHYSWLATIESNWALGNLGQSDASASVMTEFLNAQGPTPLQGSFTYSPSSPQTGQTITFAGSAIGGTMPYSYSWTFGDSSTGTGQSSTHSYTASGAFSVTMTVKDSASPQNTATTTNAVVVAPVPPPDFGISADAATLSIQQGSTGSATLTLTSISAFAGSVTFSTTITPAGPTVSLSSSSITLTSGGTGTSAMTVSTTSATPLATYSIVVAGSSAALSHSLTISVTVTSQPPPPPPPGKSPTLVGWGGVRLEEAAAGSAGLSATSNVFPGESISSLEAHLQLFQSLGYNTVRVSFENQCNSPMPQLGPYSATNLDRAIKIAKYYNFWIIVDWHGYHDLEPTYLSCWLSTWKGIVQQFAGSYSQIVWEPENEPIGGSNSSGGSISLSQLSSGYQQWIDQARGLGDTHYIVVPNLCIYTCSGWPTAAATSWPTVNDTVGHIFINMHTYMYYPYWSAQGWNNATADNAANTWYQAVVQGMQTTGWPALNTEGGADWISGSPPDVVVPGPGSVSATVTTIHFVQRLIYLNDHNSPRIGWVLWPAGLWTNCCTGGGLYGALQPGGWGNQITFLSLNNQPSFGLSVSPSTLSIVQGASATSTVTVSSINSLTGTISLSATVAPSGVVASLSQSSIVLVAGGSGTSILTITTTSTTSVGSYAATIVGTNGTLSRTVTLSFLVTAPIPPDFTVSSSQSSLSIVQGSSGSTTLTLSSSGAFAGSLNLPVSVSTSAATASTSPNMVSLSSGGTGTSTLTVSTSQSIAAGSFSVQVTANSGTLSHSVTISVTVTLPPDFGISASPSSISIPSGSSGSVMLTLTSLNGFTGALSLAVTVSSSGITTSLSTSSPTLSPGGQAGSSLTISPSSLVSPGAYTLSVTGTGSALSHSIAISITVTVPAILPLQGAMSWAPTASVAGQTVTFAASATNGIQPYSFAWDFGDGSTGSGATVSHVYSQSGTYTVKLVVVDASSITVAVQNVLNIGTASTALTLVTVPGPETAPLGSMLSFTVNASNPSGQGPISISATNLPPGASFTSTSGNPATGTFSWTPARSVQPGSYTVTFNAVQAGSSYPASKSVAVNVPAAPSGGQCLFLCQVPSQVWSLVSLVMIGATVGLLLAAGLITFSKAHRLRPRNMPPTPISRSSMPSRVGVSPIYGNMRNPYGGSGRSISRVHKPASRRLIQESVRKRSSVLQGQTGTVKARRKSP
jgi:PKD repeat protein